jgi:hypothetical protein
MFQRHLINGLLASFALVVASSLAQAACCPPPCCTPAPSCEPAPMIKKTITVFEWVPETYETTRTTYKTEMVQEAYTAYKMVSVPEVRTITRHITKMVPEIREEMRTITKLVPTTEVRTGYKRVVSYRHETTFVTKVVDRGHWETVMVPAGPSLLDRLCGRKCDPCDPCCCEPQKFKCKKVWVPCKECIQVPVTKCVKHVECVPYTYTVCVNKCVTVQEPVKVCTYKCVTEAVTENCTVNVCKCVPYTATRCVAKCVPVTEKVLCTRMVCKPVTKEVCEPACPPPACCKIKHRLFCF